jgi:hypothetical protein
MESRVMLRPWAKGFRGRGVPSIISTQLLVLCARWYGYACLPTSPRLMLPQYNRCSTKEYVS